jgi:ubiquinone/menaquinone biosynthesis C-methylase UbiE
MKAKFTANEIRDFWTKQAVTHKTAPTASWSDVLVIEKEIAEIGSRLADGDRVLDVGCANGYSTASFAQQKKIHIRGVDYIPEMIAQAKERLKAPDPTLRGTMEFAVGDITKLDEPTAAYDKVVVTRVVINLPGWNRQRIALNELKRVVRPGGLLLLSEATVQGWEKLNRFRAEWDLPPIPMPPFNLYLDEQQVISELADTFHLVELVNFASSYYVGTRVLKPLLAKVTGAGIDVANPVAEWNRWFASMPAVGDYGTQKFFVLQRK